MEGTDTNMKTGWPKHAGIAGWTRQRCPSVTRNGSPFCIGPALPGAGHQLVPPLPTAVATVPDPMNSLRMPSAIPRYFAMYFWKIAGLGPQKESHIRCVVLSPYQRIPQPWEGRGQGDINLCGPTFRGSPRQALRQRAVCACSWLVRPTAKGRAWRSV